MISALSKASVSIAIALVLVAVLLNNSTLPYPDITASYANITASLSVALGFKPIPVSRCHSFSRPLKLRLRLPPINNHQHPKKLPLSAPAEPVVEKVENQSDVLFRQFQAWAASQASVTPAQTDQDTKVTQSAPAKSAANSWAEAQEAARRCSNAPTNVSTPKSWRKPRQPVQNAQVQVPPSLSAERQWTLRSE